MIANWRLKLVFGFIFIPLFILLSGRLAQWQIFYHKHFKMLAEQQRTIDIEVTSPRGTIFSSDGAVLAFNKPAWGVYINIKDLREERDTRSKSEIIHLISPFVGMTEQELDERVSMDLDYVAVKHALTEEDKKRLENLNIISLRFEEEEKRVYPEGTLASHIIGFVGKNDQGWDEGRYGIEGYFNGDLSGKAGFVTAEKDMFGRPIVTGDMKSIFARRGRDITLTIDRGLQKIVERGIKSGVEKYEAKSGTAIVMDPKTGEILAMGNYPNYDPNIYWETQDSAILSNLAISHVYEFGSVGKVFTASGAIEENIENATVQVEGHSGCIRILNWEVCNWNKQSHGPETLQEVLQRSCNIGAYNFAKKIGNQKLYSYLDEFGVGKLANITLQEDATSFMKDWQNWNELDLAASSFGQTISATPMQIISGVSAIANGGERMQPYIVSKIEDDERVIEFEPQLIDTPISENTADIVTDMMVGVINEGNFQWYVKDIKGYKIAGKTGSAQVPFEDKPGYDASRVNVTFVAFDASPERRYIMLVRLQEPKKGEFASEIAVPVWVDIFKEMSVYLGIQPEI